MLRYLFLLFVLALAWVSPARAQDEGLETIELRVLSAERGKAVVDHGSADGLAEGDRIRFFPRDAAPFEGTVVRLQDRSAEVELLDPASLAAAGMRAEARVPPSRFEKRAEEPETEPQATEEPAQPPEGPRPRRFRNRDTEWRPGDPLLAKVRPLRPEQRPARIHGRLYAIGDYGESSEDDRSFHFVRTGVGLEYENPFGRGDRLQLDLEWNDRDVDVPDTDDDSRTDTRLDRFSYLLGGTRFERARLEVGRFLQRGAPELGVLDGAEWSLRLDSGSSYGASAGWMPEPDSEYETGSDFQVAAFYRWVADESEQLSAKAALQKTFHNSDADRDLAVLELAWLPGDGWTFRSVAWVDFYTSGDDDKGSGVELTQLVANANRRWKDGASLSLVATHFAFPEIERDEFLPVLDDQLADDFSDRLALTGRLRTSDATFARARIGGWIDQDEEGGDGELALEIEGFPGEIGFAELGAFAVRGRFTNAVGGLLTLGIAGRSSRFALHFESAAQRIDGFTSDNDDLPQHRVRASGEVHTESGWSFSAHADGSLWDDEQGWTAGLYLQRSF